MKKITLVTGLFNIGRGEMDSDFKRPFDHYLECFSRLLKVNFPMIIYIEKQYEDFIWKHRSRENTHVIVKELDYLKSFPFYDKVQKIRNDPAWINQAGWLKDSTQAKLELYNPLVMSKQFMLNDASLFNFFNTKYFMWVDAGISNTIGDPTGYLDATFENVMVKQLNKMTYIAFPYDGQVEVHGFTKQKMNEFAGKDTEYVCRGGIFGGSKSAINETNEKYYHLLSETLNQGLMGTEESVFTLLTYREPKKYNVNFIESNGLIYKFLENVKNKKIEGDDYENPLAFYALTYNTPKQFERFCKSFEKSYPEDFRNVKKYVIDNTTDKKAKQIYNDLFKQYNFEIIHEGKNIGIQDGRQKAAEHFDSAPHKYYIFFEEDFLMVDKDNRNQNSKGFIRYIPDLFNKMIDILEERDLDYLRMTVIEFFGTCDHDWSYKNLPMNKREEFFPVRDDGDEELRWKTKIEYMSIYKDVAYATGHFHYSNWPILFNKRGNKQVFLDIIYDNLFEQTIMSQNKMFIMDGKIKAGSLLAAPVYHERTEHYDGSTRRENRHYTN